MSLLTDLEAFFTDHRHCGDLNAGVDCPSCGSRSRAEPAWRGGWTSATHLPPMTDSLYRPGMDRCRFLLTSLAERETGL